MALQYLQAKLSLLPRVFSPLFDVIFSTLPFNQRMRLLLLQPLNIIAALLCAPQVLFTNRYSVIYIPTRNGRRRCLVFEPPRSASSKQIILRPLHIDIHGGAWVGGLPEQSLRWCTLLSASTGAVVVSITYSIAPRHVYPTAHDDADDIAAYLLAHAEDFGVDPRLLTIGGSSVGGNLALSVSQGFYRQGKDVPLAFVAWYPALCFRAAPWEKRKPEGFPKSDPLAVLLPLFDVYAGANRAEHLGDARLHPVLWGRETLPRDMLLVSAGVDVLLEEGVEFVEKMEGEGRVEMILVKKGFHGFMECKHLVMCR